MARLLWLSLCWGIALSAGAQTFSDPSPWRGVRGEAQALSIARDGFVVAAGQDARLWTWRAADAAWTPLAGEGVRTAALRGGRYFAIRRDGELTFFDGLRIGLAGLRALDVAIDDAGAVYAIRADGALMRRTGPADPWEALAAIGARRLATAPDNSVWLALAAGGIARWIDGKLEPVPGSARELAIGADGTVLAVDRDGILERWMPFSRSWEPEPAPSDLASIALSPQNVPWAATTNGAIVTRAALQPAPVRFDTAAPGEGGIRFGKRTVSGGTNAARALRRAAVIAVNPPSQATDPAPFVWIDTLATAASLSIAGRDGSVFALDAGGNIGRWSNLQRRFMAYPGQFAKIAVEADGNPWGINSQGRVFRRDASDWRQVRGTASDLSIGVNGQTFANTAAGALFQYDRATDGLLPLPGLLFSVAVAPDGVPWGLLQDGTVARCPAPNCQRFAKIARSLAIGPDGSVFIVTADNLLWRLNKTQDDWDMIPVLGLKVLSVAVGPRGRPWVVTDGGHVYATTFFPRDESTDLLEASTTSPQTTGSGDVAPVASTGGGFVFSKNLLFTSIPVPAGAQGVSLGPDGTVLMFVGSTGLVRFNSSKNTFETVTGLPGGNIAHAKTGPDGKLWIISGDVDGRIFHQLSGSNYETLQLPIPNPQPPVPNTMNRSINIAPDGTVYAIDTVGTAWRRPAGSTVFAKFISGNFLNLAVPRAGDVWVIDSGNVVREIVNGVAQRRPLGRDMLADDIAGGQDGSVYIATPVGGSDFAAKWNGNSQAWDQVNHVADVVGVAPDGRPWLWSAGSPTVILRAK